MATIEKRKGRDGKQVYRVKVRLYGHPTVSATFDRLTDARKWASKTESQIRTGRHAVFTSRKWRLDEAIDKFLDEVDPDKPTEYRLAWWRLKLGTAPLWTIKTTTLIALKKELLKNVGPSSVNRYLSAISAVFRRAQHEWEWLSENPVQRVKRCSEPETPVTSNDVLTEEQAEELLTQCGNSRNRHLYAIVCIALFCGARKGEIAKLEWPDFDFNRKTITFRETKNGSTRVARLPDRVHEFLRSRQRATGRVFQGDFRGAWEQARTRAGLTCRFHDLRHSFASYLAEDGRSDLEIAFAMGHKTLTMAKRYSHFRPDHNLAVQESIERRFSRSNET